MLVHDLKNPLSVVIGSLAVMKQGLLGTLSDDQRKVVDLSWNSADRLMRMIMNMLDISKMEEGKLELHPAPLELDAFLKKTVAKHDEAAAVEGKKVVLISAFSIPKIWADENILERIMDNLISNAIKHTEKEGGLIGVSAVYDEHDHEARINVRDNGEGIPSHYLNKVFDEYFQVEGQKLGTRLDTGLGLTFCKMAVTAHGGKIWAESEQGKGSTFIFTLPQA
jgi:two-component system sensor histidine kinase/response regulator